MTGVVGSGLDQIIDNHVGRAQHVLPTHPAASGNLEHNVGGLRGIVTRAYGFVPVWIKRPAQAVVRLDVMAVQELEQLQRNHLHALMKLFAGSAAIAGQRAVQTVDRGEQFEYEHLLPGGGADLGFLRRALLEIVEIGSQPKVTVLQFAQFSLQHFAVWREGRLGLRQGSEQDRRSRGGVKLMLRQSVRWFALVPVLG